jgi:hypothetical protein
MWPDIEVWTCSLAGKIQVWTKVKTLEANINLRIWARRVCFILGVWAYFRWNIFRKNQIQIQLNEYAHVELNLFVAP